MIAQFKPWMNGSKVKLDSKDGCSVDADKDYVKRERFSGGDTDRVSFTLAPGVRQKVDDLLPILGGFH